MLRKPNLKLESKEFLDLYEQLNDAITQGFLKHRDNPDRQSHFFHGRFENIYIDQTKIPALKILFKCARHAASKILDRPAEKLKYGFWFNQMYPGHITTPHSHDDDNELLSCVYYCQVPEHSGNLILHTADGEKCITPKVGMLAYFHPTMVHEVTENQSSSNRLSLAMNFGAS